jgi:hypothetical protein
MVKALWDWSMLHSDFPNWPEQPKSSKSALIKSIYSGVIGLVSS